MIKKTIFFAILHNFTILVSQATRNACDLLQTISQHKDVAMCHLKVTQPEEPSLIDLYQCFVDKNVRNRFVTYSVFNTFL